MRKLYQGNRFSHQKRDHSEPDAVGAANVTDELREETGALGYQASQKLWVNNSQRRRRKLAVLSSRDVAIERQQGWGLLTVRGLQA